MQTWPSLKIHSWQVLKYFVSLSCKAHCPVFSGAFLTQKQFTCPWKILDSFRMGKYGGVSFSNTNIINEPRHDKTNKMSMCPAKTQISQGIRPVWSVFTVHSLGSYGPKVSSCRQRRHWSDWADLSLRWVHTHFVGFVMSWLISWKVVLLWQTACLVTLVSPVVVCYFASLFNCIIWTILLFEATESLIYNLGQILRLML